MSVSRIRLTFSPLFRYRGSNVNQFPLFPLPPLHLLVPPPASFALYGCAPVHHLHVLLIMFCKEMTSGISHLQNFSCKVNSQILVISLHPYSDFISFANWYSVFIQTSNVPSRNSLPRILPNKFYGFASPHTDDSPFVTAIFHQQQWFACPN